MKKIILSASQVDAINRIERTNAFQISQDAMTFKFLKSDLFLFANCANFRAKTPLLAMLFRSKDLRTLIAAGITDNTIASNWDINFNPNSDAIIDDWNYYADLYGYETVVVIPYELRAAVGESLV